MDRPAIITYVYEYADAPGAAVLKELSPSAEDVLGFPTDEWFATRSCGNDSCIPKTRRGSSPRRGERRSRVSDTTRRTG